MKKIGEYTAKGIITSSDTEAHRIQLFDGRFDTGYRVTDFEISISYRDGTTLLVCSAKLMTDPDIQNRYWNWSKNTEIAWASATWDVNTGSGMRDPVSVVDPDNMIIQDLWIGALVYDDQAVDINYMIKMDKYELSDWQGALAMVRNKSQA